VIFVTQNLNNFQEFEEENVLEILLSNEDEETNPQLAREIVGEEELKRILQIEVCVDLSNHVFIDNENPTNIEEKEFLEEFDEDGNGNLI
jgi:hypothetical protein